jgi:type I site-specific restriction endonuclease
MKKSLSERDICTKFITPAVKQAGWDVLSQIREEVSFIFRLALKKVSLPKKETLAKYICGLADKDERKEMLESIKPTLEECLQRLEVI